MEYWNNDKKNYEAMCSSKSMSTALCDRAADALFVASGGSDAQGSQRGLEYDTASGLFAEFIDSEVVPFVSEQCGISLTSDPNGRATVGGSSGGCASFSMAWFRPDLFRKVLTYSATLTNQQYPFNPELPHGHWELHSGLWGGRLERLRLGRAVPKLARYCRWLLQLWT